MGNSGEDFSSIKALHCSDLLRVVAFLFTIVNSTVVYLRNITSPALTWHCWGIQKVTAPHISSAHPRWCGAVVTNDWCIRPLVATMRSKGVFIKPSLAKINVCKGNFSQNNEGANVHPCNSFGGQMSSYANF